MDGYEAIRIIKSKNDYSKIPIIAVTAYASDIDRKKCLELGCIDFVSKPYDTKELLLKISNHTKMKK